MDMWVLDTQTEILKHTGIQTALPGDPFYVQLPQCPVGKIADQQYLLARCQRGWDLGGQQCLLGGISEAPWET